MNAQQLKNAILQEVIEGRLVPQDPNDEPASALLERIRKEKEELVKAGKLKKKDLEVKPISEDEIPFEIPESWEWVRMSSLIQLLSGQDFPPEKYNSDNKGVPYITGASNIENGKLIINRWTETPSVIGVQGDLLIVCKGSGVGKMCISDIPRYHIARQIQIVRCISSQILLDYLKAIIDANLHIIVANAQGVIPGISREHILDLLLPLPPIAEQYHIVAKIEELLPKVEEYGKAQDALDKLNAELPERLKKSILQEAIEGRLVPQDPNDEPASVLLDKIRKEKEKLAKAGKLKKKDLIETPITEDEIPFEIPESWEWVRVKDIVSKIVDGDHNPPKGLSCDSGYYMLSSKNVNYNGIAELDSVRYLSYEDWEKCNERTNLQRGDVLLTTVGTLGRSCVYEGDKPYCFQRSVSIIQTFVFNYYLKYCFDSPFFQTLIDDKATGTAQRGFYLNQLEDAIIPLPPLAEQHRIVMKLEQLLGEIDKLKK